MTRKMGNPRYSSSGDPNPLSNPRILSTPWLDIEMWGCDNTLDGKRLVKVKEVFTC